VTKQVSENKNPLTQMMSQGIFLFVLIPQEYLDTWDQNILSVFCKLTNLPPAV
jgi:hypothetical protein